MPMQEVIKKEIIKLLDLRVIYHIVDSSWPYHVQCVAKNVRINVVFNEKNYLVSMGPMTR